MLKSSDNSGRSVSVPEFIDSPPISDSSSPGFDADELLRHGKTPGQADDFVVQRDSGCESGPNNSTSNHDDRTSSSQHNRDSIDSTYDAQILRKNKRAVTRLHPTVSNVEASKFIFDSMQFDDDVFTSPAKERVVVTDSGLSSISCSTTAASPPPSTPSSVYEDASFNVNYPPIPALPNPRLEMSWGTSPFNEIRLFLANNRSRDEFYPTPDRSETDGKAVQKLKSFLESLP